MSLAGIVACQVGNAFACRSSRESIRALGWRSNGTLLMAIAVEVGLLLMLIYTPSLAALFGLASLGYEHWALLAMFGPLLLLLEEGRKGLATWRHVRRVGS